MATPSLPGLPLATLSEMLASRTRALAVRRWLYTCRPVPNALPERIEDVAASAWADLRASAALPDWTLAERQVSVDGTIKYALEVDGANLETVLIPAGSRSTVCVSSQSG